MGWKLFIELVGSGLRLAGIEVVDRIIEPTVVVIERIRIQKLLKPDDVRASKELGSRNNHERLCTWYECEGKGD